MHEHERAGLLGRRPEGLEAVVAEEHAAHAGGHLDAAQRSLLHQRA